MRKRSTRSGSCHALGPCGLGWGTRNNEDSHTVSENKPQMFPINSPVSDKVSYEAMNKKVLDKIMIHGWLAFILSSHLFGFRSIAVLHVWKNWMNKTSRWAKFWFRVGVHTPDVFWEGRVQRLQYVTTEGNCFLLLLNFNVFAKLELFLLRCKTQSSTFIQRNLQCIQDIHSISMCVPWDRTHDICVAYAKCDATNSHFKNRGLVYEHTGLRARLSFHERCSSFWIVPLLHEWVRSLRRSSWEFGVIEYEL